MEQAVIVQHTVDLFDTVKSQQMFQKVEEESERRAQRTHSMEYDRDREIVPSGSATMRPPKERRRGSISISRFGQVSFHACSEALEVKSDVQSEQVTEPLTPKDANGPPTPTLLSIIASRATFYQADVAVRSIFDFLFFYTVNLPKMFDRMQVLPRSRPLAPPR